MQIFVAYSGGLDSCVLLHLLTQIRQYQPYLDLNAIHINHNLSTNAKKWDQHCKKICKDLKVKYIVKQVNANIKIKDQSVEEIARNLRYAAFTKILPKNAVLMTAHHANDQAETLLLQLFRGAGPKGLAAMAPKKEFAQGWLVRPLLHYSRQDLLEYAKEHKLDWIEDESNTDIKFSRNLIRHTLMPIIRQNWPGITKVLNRVAGLCAQTNKLIEELGEQDLAIVATQSSGEAGGIQQLLINITKLNQLSLARQNNVLRFWLQKLSLPIPSEVKIKEILRAAVNSRKDANPIIAWPGVQIRKFNGNLYAMPPLAKHDSKIILFFDIKKKVNLPSGLGILSIKINKGLTKKYQNKKFSIRFRTGGEKLFIPKRKATHELKKLMQEWQVPPWMRDRIPLVYCEDQIVAIIGYYNVYGLKVFITSNIGKCSLDNPDLPVNLIKDIVAMQRLDKSLAEPFKFGE